MIKKFISPFKFIFFKQNYICKIPILQVFFKNIFTKKNIYAKIKISKKYILILNFEEKSYIINISVEIKED